MLLIAALAATLWTMPTSPPVAKADRLPAPQVVMRWKVPSSLPVAKADTMPGNVPPVCQQTKAHPAAKGDKPLSHSLDKEPAANGYAAVLYSEGNCTKPVMVSRAIGHDGGAKKKPATR